MACVENDIKRVLAYSTVSQLGYMMAAAGAGAAPTRASSTCSTHGVFKALLFLAAGAVIHAVGTNDIFRMGGLFRAMPQTGIVFIVGTLALAGVPPLSGFFSKEAILGGVWEAHLTGPVPHAGAHRVPDGLLHVPRRLPGLLRPRRTRPATRTMRPG